MEGSEQTTNNSRKAKSKGKSKANAGTIMKLRDVPPSGRFFWKQTTEEQLSSAMKDQYSHYSSRDMPKHETLVMALNEIAAAHKEGFFMHMPSRQTLTSSADEGRLPPERTPEAPVATFTSILFMNFVWSDEDVANFVTDTQRARYLRSSAILHPPPASTPLYAVQFIFTTKTPIFAMNCDFTVLVVTKQSYFLLSAQAIETALGRRDSDPGKFNSIAGLWKEDRNTTAQAFEAYRMDTLEEVYQEVMRSCSSRETEASFAAQDLMETVIPRPSRQSAVMASSTRPLGQRLNSEARSRWGEKRITKKSRATRQAGQDENEDQGGEEEVGDHDIGGIVNDN